MHVLFSVRRWLFCACLAAVLPAQAQTSLDSLLTTYVREHKIPALAAAVVKKGKIIAAGAVGTRVIGRDIPVTLQDRFHLGSDTKAMTALLCAMLVDEGKLRWDSTVGEIFPELKDKMDPGLQRATVAQLLSHTSGLTGDTEKLWLVLEKAGLQEGTLEDNRYWLLQQWMGEPLASKQGGDMVYSNLGYTIAGSIIERVGGRSWEETITQRLFVPLGLSTAGLGPQMSLGKTDAPWGHMEIDGKLKAFGGGPSADVPLPYGPAGIAHMSVLDFARWAGWNAGGGKRGPALVKPATLDRLHKPVGALPPVKNPAPGTPHGGRYGLGWGELDVDWAPHPILFHGGSNAKNLAHIWVDRVADIAIVIVANSGGERPNTAFFALAPVLYRMAR